MVNLYNYVVPTEAMWWRVSVCFLNLPIFLAGDSSVFGTTLKVHVTKIFGGIKSFWKNTTNSKTIPVPWSIAPKECQPRYQSKIRCPLVVFVYVVQPKKEIGLKTILDSCGTSRSSFNIASLSRTGLEDLRRDSKVWSVPMLLWLVKQDLEIFDDLKYHANSAWSSPIATLF